MEENLLNIDFDSDFYFNSLSTVNVEGADCVCMDCILINDDTVGS